MLELLLLFKICKWLNGMATVKGWPGYIFGGVMAITWFLLGTIGAVIGWLTCTPGTWFMLEILACYYFGCGFAVLLNYLIVDGLKDQIEAEVELRRIEDRDELEDEAEYIRKRTESNPVAVPVRRGNDVEALFSELPLVATKVRSHTSTSTDTPPPRAKRVWKRKWSG